MRGDENCSLPTLSLTPPFKPCHHRQTATFAFLLPFHHSGMWYVQPLPPSLPPSLSPSLERTHRKEDKDGAVRWEEEKPGEEEVERRRRLPFPPPSCCCCCCCCGRVEEEEEAVVAAEGDWKGPPISSSPACCAAGCGVGTLACVTLPVAALCINIGRVVEWVSVVRGGRGRRQRKKKAGQAKWAIGFASCELRAAPPTLSQRVPS